jgi:tripartite-type tricarboxylate transporter receptor subunit TctC
VFDRRRFLAATGAGLAGSILSSSLHAQIVGKTARIISGFPAGGMGDAVSRPMAEKLRGAYAPVVITESKTGAGGRIAVEFVKNAEPDGATILQIPGSIMTVYPHIYKKLGYDVLRDFAPVTTTCTYTYSLTAGPGLPPEVKTVPELVQWLKANPKQASFGSPSAGSSLHFTGVMFARAAGVELTHVAYKGGAPLLQGVMGGEIPISLNVLGEIVPHVRSGRLRSLAVTSAARSRFLPEVPTLVELGYKDLAAQDWLGWFLPAKTPTEIVAKLNAILREELHSKEMVESLAKVSLEPVTMAPEEFARVIKRDLDKWAPIVKSTGFTAED